jgi:uncharacterized membrane protein YqgA involved in biofilm formation
MLGVLVNGLAIVVGGGIGLILKQGLPEAVKHVVMQAIGLAVIVIGMSYALLTQEVLLMVLSLVIGGAIGAMIRIEDRLEAFGRNVEERFRSAEGGFAKGFVLATLVYCVGSMAIIGSIEAGVNNDHTMLFIKSILDGVSAIVFTATLGYGVLFSALPVVLYQGIIVIVGVRVEPFLTEQLIDEMGAVGGVIILGIGINLLNIARIRVGDLLPAVFLPILYFLFLALI